MSSSSSPSPIPSYPFGPQSAEPLPPLVVPLDDLTGTGYEARIARAVARRVRERAPLLKVDMEPTSMSVSRNVAMALTSVDYSGVFVRATGAILPNPKGFVREDDPREVHEFVEKLNAGRKNVDALLSAIDGLRGVSEDWDADADELEAFLLGSREGTEGTDSLSPYHPFPVLCGVYDPRRTALLKDLVDGNILYSLGNLEDGSVDFPGRWPAQPDWSSLNPSSSVSVSLANPGHVSTNSVTYQSVPVVASGPSYSQTAFQGASYLPGCYQGQAPSVSGGTAPTVLNVVDPSVVSRMSQDLSAVAGTVHSVCRDLSAVAGHVGYNAARFDSFLRMRGLTENGMRTSYSAVVQQKEDREREAMETMVNSGVGSVLWIGTDVALVTDATRPVFGDGAGAEALRKDLRDRFPTAMNAPRGTGDDNRPGEPRVGAVSSGTVKALVSLALANWKAEVLAVAGTLPNNPNIPDRSFLESVAVAGATIASFSLKNSAQRETGSLMDPSCLPSPPSPAKTPDLPLPLGMSSTLFTSFDSSVVGLLADEADASAERKAAPFSMKRVLRERLLESPVLQSVLDHFRTVGSHVGTMEFSYSIEDQDGVLRNQVFTLPKDDAERLLRGMFCPSRTRELQLRHRGVAQGDLYRFPGERMPSVPSGTQLPTFFGALVVDPLAVLKRCPHLSGPSRKRLLRAYRRLRRVVENPPTPGTPVPDPEQELRDLSSPTPFSDRITQPRILQHTEGFLYRVLSEMKTRATNSTGKRVPVSSSSTTSATTVFVVEPLPDLRIPEFVLVPSSQK